MMDKLILSSSYDWNDWDRAPVTLVNISSKGPDRSSFTKSAALFDEKIASIRSEPGTSVLHVIAMGASDRYGPNKNADGFKRAMLKKAHPTFVTNGHVFKEHDNDDPKKASGSVLYSAYNNPMDRVELMIRVKNAAWSEELQKVANNQDITVSMSCRVPYDVCSYCNNKAPTRASYCDHMKKYAGQMLDDGHLVHCDNPSGTFFDISGVRKQADRIAYGLRKVASLYTPVVTGAELFEMWSKVDRPLHTKSASSTRKSALLAKLADMEKEIEATIGSSENQALSCAFNNDADIDQLKRCADGGGDSRRRDILRALEQAQISLPLNLFAQLFAPEFGMDATDSAESLLPGIFSRMFESGDNSCCCDCGYDFDDDAPVSDMISSLVHALVPRLSLAHGPARGRIIRMTAVGKPRVRIIKSGSVVSTGATGLAREYAKYKLSFIDGAAGGTDSPLTRLSVLQHFFS